MKKITNKDPAIIFYTSDFLIGCADLTMEERGQYITMLCLQHQHGHLSKRIIDLNINGISDIVLSKFSKDKNGFYYNKRLDLEIEKRKEHSKKQRENALKRWSKSDKQTVMPLHSQSTCQSDGKVMPLENDNDNENEIENKNIKLLEFIEDNFSRTLSPIEIEKVYAWLESFDYDSIKYAITIAVNSNIKNFAYVEGIFKNWKSRGLKDYRSISEYVSNSQKVVRENNQDELFDYDWLNDTSED